MNEYTVFFFTIKSSFTDYQQKISLTEDLFGSHTIATTDGSPVAEPTFLLLLNCSIVPEVTKAIVTYDNYHDTSSYFGKCEISAFPHQNRNNVVVVAGKCPCSPTRTCKMYMLIVPTAHQHCFMSKHQVKP